MKSIERKGASLAMYHKKRNSNAKVQLRSRRLQGNVKAFERKGAKGAKEEQEAVKAFDGECRESNIYVFFSLFFAVFAPLRSKAVKP